MLPPGSQTIVIMKQLLLIFTILFSAPALFAQTNDIKTEAFKVEGNCNMCKKRIEKAAFVKGVKRAEWDKESHVLNVVYRPSKTTATEIAKAVAKVGHSSEKLEAAEADYKELPQCCQYKTHSCND